MDLCDVALLHLPTFTWLPQHGLPSYHPQRGGTNALVRAVSAWGSKRRADRRVPAG